MGWVVLTLRKKELKRTHADYQMRDLQIAREQRQMSRQYQYEQSVIQGQQNEEVRDLRTSYNDQRSSLRDQLSVLREDQSESGSSETAAEIAEFFPVPCIQGAESLFVSRREALYQNGIRDSVCHLSSRLMSFLIISRMPSVRLFSV